MVLELSSVVKDSHVWKMTLGLNYHGDAIEHLRTAFLLFRERASFLAEAIRRDVPDLTVHDITHLDALWEMASLIVGSDIQLTPTEGFVLGGAILLHDLATSIAATPNGLAGLRQDIRWKDVVVTKFKHLFRRFPSAAEVDAPPSEIFRSSIFEVLRQLHAENAEKLAFQTFQGEYLIEDLNLRNFYGRTIGKIAHSHWWSTDELVTRLGKVIGAPNGYPGPWTVDPLKLACILRLADVAHVDARRAPSFLRKISIISDASMEHWKFQERLAKPYLKDDTLVFASGQAFALDDAAAWWLCYDSLRYVDKELRSVDALLADQDGFRLAAKRVAGVESPERFAVLVQTDGWLPINATVHVGDLPRLVANLGRRELYGNRPSVALRELIQNGRDAVVARRILEHRNSKFGRIIVSIDCVNDSYWLTVADTGIGMSRRVLTEYLLNFGTSFWGSSAMQQELPGLAAGGMAPVGKYGIGFFAVFMAGDEVRVISRRPDAAASDTLVLEFGQGLARRPLLRAARPEERLIEGGTRVSVRLRDPPCSNGGLLNEGGDFEWKLKTLMLAQCPALDVDVHLHENGDEIQLIAADDWRSVPAEDLLVRVMAHSADEYNYYWYPQNNEDIIEDVEGLDNDQGSDPIIDPSEREKRESLWCKKAALNLRDIVDNGILVGRALICAGDVYASRRENWFVENGLVVTGGLSVMRLNGIGGILVGEPERAARDKARPIVSDEALRQWATEQTALVSRLYELPEDQAACAAKIRLCGAHTGELPICEFRTRWLSAPQIISHPDIPDRVILVDRYQIYNIESSYGVFIPGNDAIVVAPGGRFSLVEDNYSDSLLWPSNMGQFIERGWLPWRGLELSGAVIEALCERWHVPLRKVVRRRSLQERRTLVIGKVGTRNIRAPAYVVYKPKNT